MNLRRLVAGLATALVLSGAGPSRAQQDTNQVKQASTNSLRLPPWGISIMKAAPGIERPCPSGRCDCSTPDVKLPALAPGKHGIWTLAAEYELDGGVFVRLLAIRGPNPYEGAPPLTDEEAGLLKEAVAAAVGGASCAAATGRVVATNFFGFRYSSDSPPVELRQQASERPPAPATAPEAVTVRPGEAINDSWSGCGAGPCSCTMPAPMIPPRAGDHGFRVNAQVVLQDGVFEEVLKLDGPSRIGGGIVMEGGEKARIRFAVTEALKQLRCTNLPGRRTINRTFNLFYR